MMAAWVVRSAVRTGAAWACLMTVGLVCPAGPAQAQAPATPPIIRSIEIQRRNVFAREEATTFLPRLINGLHVTTQEAVIARELLFRVGDPVDTLLLSETARNLRRLGIFRRVQIDTVRVDSLGVHIRVDTQDGWSTQPTVSFRSSGNQTAWSASLTEENLAGTASRVLLAYVKDPDRSALVLGFSQPRLLARGVGIAFRYDDRSDGSAVFAQIARPYFSLDDRRTWGLSLDTRDERVLRYVGGATVASDTVIRQLDHLAASYGWSYQAGPKGYYRISLLGHLWRDDYAREDAVFGPRLALGALGAHWEWRHARYLVTRGFTTSRDEDVDLSSTIRLGLHATPKAFGFDDNGMVARVGVHTGGVLTDRIFGYLDLNAHGRFTGAGLDSGAVQAAATLVLSPRPRHSAILHGWTGWLENPRPGGEFDLGLDRGPRGFRLHAFTGDRGFFTTGEYRVMVAEDWLRVADLGVAGFVDYGGAWFDGDPQRTGWNAGVGLRFRASRALDDQITRIDFVYRGDSDREAGGWVLVIGRGVLFSTNGILNR